MTTPETAPVEVTQADRDALKAAWDEYASHMGDPEGRDDTETAFEASATIIARHRTTNETARQDGLREALVNLLARDVRNTCQHENTYRGGAIWEICSDCDAKWADDEGGKPEWTDPPEWTAARAALSDISPLANDAAAARVTNGQYATDDFGPVADAARRIASYCEGDARGRVYRAAKQELANDTGALREALVDHNERLRSAVAIADRDGADTNWLAFRGQCRFTLAEHHDVVNAARAAVARKAGYAPGNYSIVCIDCRKECQDCDKRAIRCADCAAALSPDDGEGK